MNNVQNYQISFQSGYKRKAVKTLADKLNENKEKRKMITDFKNKYHLYKEFTADIVEFSRTSTPQQLRIKLKTIVKNLEELLDEIMNME